MPQVALPPKARAVIYLIIGTVGAALGALQTVFITMDKGQPAWLTITLAVFTFIAGGFGYTAASNTALPRRALPEDETA